MVDDEKDTCTVYQIVLLNGFELCKNIIELDKAVRIVFITALPEYYKDIRDQSYPELINTTYVQKPITNKELVELVNTIIDTSR